MAHELHVAHTFQQHKLPVKIIFM